MLVAICLAKGLRIIIENPYDDSMHYLKNNFLSAPSVYDKNRMERGDYFKKPTGYWYFNYTPTYGESYQNDKKQKTHKLGYNTYTITKFRSGRTIKL